MLHGIEEKRNLIIVRKFAGGFQVLDKLQYLFVPLIRIVHACEFHDCGTVESGFLVWFDPFIVTEVIPAKLELRTVRGSHPLIVEVNDVTVGAVVNDQRNHSAFAFCKLLRKLQDITDGSTSKSIQALVIVTDHADVLMVSGEKEHKLLLNEVRVLVLVHHDVRNLGAKLLQNLDIVLQQMIGFNLDRREVHQIALSEDIAVLLQYPSKSRNRQVSIGHQFLWRHQFFGEVIHIVADSFRLLPCAAVRQSNLYLRDIPETVDILEHHVLLVERIQETVVSAKSCKFKMLLKDTKTE